MLELSLKAKGLAPLSECCYQDDESGEEENSEDDDEEEEYDEDDKDDKDDKKEKANVRKLEGKRDQGQEIGQKGRMINCGNEFEAKTYHESKGYERLEFDHKSSNNQQYTAQIKDQSHSHTNDLNQNIFIGTSHVNQGNYKNILVNNQDGVINSDTDLLSREISSLAQVAHFDGSNHSPNQEKLNISDIVTQSDGTVDFEWVPILCFNNI